VVSTILFEREATGVIVAESGEGLFALVNQLTA
jgi:hypothetical protein